MMNRICFALALAVGALGLPGCDQTVDAGGSATSAAGAASSGGSGTSGTSGAATTGGTSGGSSTGGTGGNTVEGPLGFSVQSALGTLETVPFDDGGTGVSYADVGASLLDIPLTCAQVATDRDAGINPLVTDFKVFSFHIYNPLGNVQPGTYDARCDGGQFTCLEWASYASYHPDGGETLDLEYQSGSITYTQVTTTGTLVGNYDLVLGFVDGGNATSFTGTINAPYCTAL